MLKPPPVASSSTTDPAAPGSTPVVASLIGVQPVLPIPLVDNAHSMTARGKIGFQVPIQRLGFHTAVLSPLPKTFLNDLADPNWRAAMTEEFKDLQHNNT